MKSTISCLFICSLLMTISHSGRSAAVCALNGGDPQNTIRLEFESKAFTASLIGFDEFTGISNPRRVYRRKTITGNRTHHIYQAADNCDAWWTDHISVYDLTCQYDRISGAFSTVNNSTLTYFGSTQPLGVSCSEPVNGTVTATTVVEQFGVGTCVPWGWYDGWYHALARTGTVTAALADEDTEQDAKDRAVKTPGSSNTAFRTSRTGLSFSECEVRYKATFDIACPGEYDIYLYYSTKPHGAAGPVTTKAVITRRTLQSGPQTVQGTIQIEDRDIDYTLTGVQLHSPCSEQPPSRPEITVGSVKMRLSLGRGVAGANGGEIRLDATTITAGTYTSAALTAATVQGGGVEIVRDSAGALRQLKAPQTLADIVTLNATSYEVRFYGLNDVGAQDTATKIYTLTGTPYAVFKVENPDAAQNLSTRVRITETRGSLVRVNEYSYDSVTAVWSLATGNGLRRESVLVTVNGLDTTKVSTIRDENNVVVSKTSKTYRAYPWGSEVIQEVLDSDGAALATTTDFYSNASTDGGAYGHLKQQVRSDSSWVRYTYDSFGRAHKVIRPYLNAALNAADNLCRVVENAYSTLPDADGDGIAEQLTTTTESILGQEISRTYRIDWSKSVMLATQECTRRTDIRCVAAGAAWNAAGNLLTETLTSAIDPFVGRDCRVVNPDGTATLTTYSLAGNGILTTTVKSGVPNVAKDDINDGRRVVTVTSAAGQVTSEQVFDISSGLSLTTWVATQFDSLGRPTRLDFDDGTFITKDYACCGLSSERDRTGLVTSYSYDALGRQITATRLGITTKTTYDADGRIKAIIRVGTNGTEMTRESSVYDLAGRLVERRDAGNRLTTFIESINATTGQTTRTTTNPDTGTIIEVSARDGSRISVSGTAIAPHAFEYGIDASGVFVTDTLIGQDSGGSPTTTEWVKNYTDFAGRPYKIVYADNATAQSFYNVVGQLVRQVDADGVTTLFAYNARGELESTAIDLNGNNTIDAAGTDRLTKTVSVVATKTESSVNYTVLRATTQIWETDNQDLPITVSIGEQSSDGLRTWQTTRSLVTKSVTALDGSGGRTLTTTTPDGVKTIQIYAGDRLSSTTVKTAADVQISGAMFAYDTHGRMSSTTDARNGTTTFTYSADDQIQTVTTPDPDTTLSGPGYDPQTTTYAYNSAGRVQAVTQPDNGLVTTTYWLTGAVRRTAGARTYPVEYTYDPQGRVKTLTTWQNFAGDTGKAVTTWNYDPARGFLLNKRYTDSTGPAYTYKPSGRLLTRTWARTPVITTTYSYNAAGDLLGTDYSDATPDVAITYDRIGRPKTITDGSGARALSYHSSGQLEDETYTSGVLNGIAVDRSFDSLYRLSGLAVPSVSSATYAYDAASRLETVTTGQNTATYTYVANSPLAGSVTFRNNGTTRLATTKTYDKINRLSAISNQPSAVGALAIAHDYQYNSANQRTRATREDNTSWGYAYDALGQVTTGSKFLADNSAALGLAYSYTYDDIGNRKTATANGQAATYTPTLLNQYSQRTVPGAIDVLGAADAAATVTVAVNSGTPQATTRQGERFHKQVSVANTSAAQDTQLKITGVKNLAGPNQEDVVSEITKTTFTAQTPETFSHDLDGNLITDARWQYFWDGENRLVAIETSATAVSVGVTRQKFEFGYDGQNRRVSKRIYNWSGSAWTLSSHTLFVYDGWNLLADLNAPSSNTIVCTYVWGLDLSGSLQGASGVGGLLFSTLNGQTTIYGYACDGNGNVIALVDMSSGAKGAGYDYDAFGETVAIEGTAGNYNAFRFSTKFADETRLLYYGYRFYDVNCGRWPSRDPIGEVGGINLYGYVENSPTNLYDPDGARPATPRVGPTSSTYRPLRGWPFGIRPNGSTTLTPPTGPTYLSPDGTPTRPDGSPITGPVPLPSMPPPRRPGPPGGGVASFCPNPGDQNRDRRAAVDEAWRMEAHNVRFGGPRSRQWTFEEETELILTGRVSGYVGHHINSVGANPQLARNPFNIEFVRAGAERLNAHNGNYRNPTWGPLIPR